jgi:hypothetical protein
MQILMKNLKRIVLATSLGALLGIFCILGASGRVGGWKGNEILLIGLWYNRVIMGLLIGFTGSLELFKKGNTSKWVNSILRGAIFGLLVSLQFYLSTIFLDLLSFLAGILYGIVIDLLCVIFTHKS